VLEYLTSARDLLYRNLMVPRYNSETGYSRAIDLQPTYRLVRVVQPEKRGVELSTRPNPRLALVAVRGVGHVLVVFFEIVGVVATGQALDLRPSTRHQRTFSMGRLIGSPHRLR